MTEPNTDGLNEFDTAVIEYLTANGENNAAAYLADNARDPADLGPTGIAREEGIDTDVYDLASAADRIASAVRTFFDDSQHRTLEESVK